MEDKNEPDYLKPGEDPMGDEDQEFEPIDRSDDMTEQDDGFIELDDVTEASPDDQEELLKLNDAEDGSSDQDDGIITLTDVVESSDKTEAAIVTEAGGAADDVSSDEEQIFESEEESLEGSIGLEPFDDEMHITREPEDDIIKSLGVDLTTEIVGFEEPADLDEKDEKASETTFDTRDEIQDAPVDSASFSPGQIEAAIERVIVRLYSEKIEGIIVEAIEKAVKKEIEKINILLKDVLENGK